PGAPDHDRPGADDPRVILLPRSTRPFLFLPGVASGARTRVADLLGDIRVLVGKVLVELRRQVLRLGFISGRILPGVLRDQQVRVDTRHHFGHIQVDDAQVYGFSVVEFAGQDCIDHRAGGRDAETLAFAVRATGPAGVDQEYVRIEFVHALHQQLGILTGATREEGCTEAGGEGALDAGAGAHFGGAHQRGVTGQEVIGRCFTGQLGDGRQYTGQVAGQEDNVLGFAGAVLDHALVDVFQRVGRTGVLRLRYVGVIRNARDRIHHHVFQYRTELDCVPDHRLVLLRQVDALGVATALDVEHHALAPAVLVVT